MSTLFTQNPDFYPTPLAVIQQMTSGLDLTNKVILEPSAGSGNIVRYLAPFRPKQILACEKDRNLRAILSSLPCRILSDDFLLITSEQVSHIDYIIMNPPFSEGIDHILHAYEIAPPGCRIVSLVNSGNLLSSNQKPSRLKELIADCGSTTDIGNAFSTAERHTDCPVTIVSLTKPGERDEFADFFLSDIDDDIVTGNQEGLVQYNLIRDLVGRYVSCCRMFEQVNDLSNQINDLARPSKEMKYPPIVFSAHRESESYSSGIDYETYKKELQKYYWKFIFNKLSMEKYSTHKLRDQINAFIEQHINTPFTMRNIYSVINCVIQTTPNRMQTALDEAFDTICSFSAENSTAGEHWKTNANYMVNRKFIVPNITKYDNRYSDSSIDIGYNYSNTNKMDDVTKALCFLTANDFDKIGIIYKTAMYKPWGTWFNWGFFRCKGFKKGTMHFEFLDEDVWYRFNQAVASNRGWSLPKKTNASKKS